MRPLLGLLIYLTLLSVLVFNNRFFFEVFATSTESTEELSSEDEEKEEDFGSSTESETAEQLTPQHTQESPEAISSTIGLKESEDDRNPDEDSGSEESNNDRFRHNAEEIAMELSNLSPAEITEYPITDLSDKDITLVFRFLDPSNLAKVLLNIPQENLVEIQDRLTPADFNQPLSRISELDRKQVVDRIMLSSIN